MENYKIQLQKLDEQLEKISTTAFNAGHIAREFKNWCDMILLTEYLDTIWNMIDRFREIIEIDNNG